MYASNDFRLYHHGIRGQKWGDRNGPPYPLGGGDYSVTEKKAIYRERKNKNSIYNKKHFDKVIRQDKDTLTTLSYDKNRTKNVDMFYAAYTKTDKHQYNVLFNKKIPQDLYDSDGNKVGIGNFYKYRINNKVSHDVKVASEDSASKVFQNLYKKDRDFYNFVTDKSRMESHFVEEKYKFSGYRKARKVLDKMKNPDYKPTDTDLKTIYRMFNYVIPSDGKGNQREAHDVAVQRAKFFKELKKDGYGAVLDTNDTIYGGFKTQASVIVFDSESIIPSSITRTNAADKKISELAFVGRKALNI